VDETPRLICMGPPQPPRSPAGFPPLWVMRSPSPDLTMAAAEGSLGRAPCRDQHRDRRLSPGGQSRDKAPC